MTIKKEAAPAIEAAPNTQTTVNTELTEYTSPKKNFPAPMSKDAYCGIAGEIVDMIFPFSEATKEALLTQFLVGFGNIIGRKACIRQAGLHHCNEFLAIVGDTADRKGTSLSLILDLLHEIDRDWTRNQIIKGIASGEAIIHAVRDPKENDEGEKEDGADDKRALFLDTELARLLNTAARSGNILSHVLRDAWDCAYVLQNTTKNSPAIATEAHISLISHVTREDLAMYLKAEDIANGFANRFLWIATTKSKVIPRPKHITWEHEKDILDPISKVIKSLSLKNRTFDWTEKGGKEWDDWYHYEDSKQSKRTGVAAKMMARIPPHTLRLAMTFAVLDRASLISEQHLKAAIAITEYSSRTIQWIFSEATGNQSADKVVRFLRRHKICTRTHLRQHVFKNGTTTEEIDSALISARASGSVDCIKQSAKTRPIEYWFATEFRSQVEALISDYKEPDA